MDDLLDIVISVLPFELFFIKRFVEDILAAFPVEWIGEITEIFNSYDPLIQFTIETEDQQRSIAFLDTKIIRTENYN